MFHVKHPPQDAKAFAERLHATPGAMLLIEQFRSMLSEESSKLNLVGPSVLDDFWPRHAFDSAQLIEVSGGAQTFADLGAGAGFPGLVIAILLKDDPDAHVHLVESQTKRCRFLQVVVDRLELAATVHNQRAEDFTQAPSVEIVTARACAPLARLFDYALPFIRGGARGLFLKGRNVEAELVEARRSWRFEADLTPSLSDPEGRIVRLEALARVRSDRHARA